VRALLTLSMKGGVGKTTTAIGLAQALRREDYRVGLLDLDVHGSALPRALHLARDPGYEPLLGGKLRPVWVDGIQLFSIGLLFHDDTPNMWDGEQKASAVKQVATFAIAWEDVEWIVVDTPPTSGEEVQSLLENLPDIHGAIILTQPNDLSLLGITKTLEMLRETETPVCGILANMAGYTCPHCGRVSNPFDRETVDVEKLARSFGVPYLGHVPFAGEEARQTAYEAVVGHVLRHAPVRLHKEKGGLSRWLLEKLVT